MGLSNFINKLAPGEWNSHLKNDIFGHPFTGSYEHKNEKGEWVPGPALGHGSEDAAGEYLSRRHSAHAKVLKDLTGLNLPDLSKL